MNERFQNNSRRTFFNVVIGVLFAVFLVRLIQLQFLYQDVYGKKSEENSIRHMEQNPIRGLIYDRNGILLVDNRASYTVTITPSEFNVNTIRYLTDILQLDSIFVSERLEKGKLKNRFTPIKIKRDINFQTLSFIEENRDKLPGVGYKIESKRFYPSKAKATHLLGYTKEISDKQLSQLSDEYSAGDNIGATGIEAAYEKYLRGHKGYKFITVNAKGQMLGTYNNGSNDIPVREGDDLYLTLDENLQALAESLLTPYRGAIVAIDPSDGGVLSLVSKPDFDLSVFGAVTPTKLWNALNSDPSRPLFNRATMTRYPPGSAFKMVLAAAALQERIIDQNWRVNCQGAFRFGTRVFKDHIAHGSTNIVEAIQRSCNVFFYQLMLKTGLERWTHYGKEFGFGSPTGIDLFEESSGLLPSVKFFNKVYGKGRWTQGYLISLAIGQGELGVSPLQMACYAAALGNKGFYHTPHVVQQIRDKEAGKFHKIPTETRKINLSEKVWAIIREGMYRCVNDPGGTGWAAKINDTAVAGKTGTAQNPHGNDHAWFIAFAPFENPEIAICVMIENVGFGGTIAAPIAKLCIEQYLFHQINRDKSKKSIASVNSKIEESGIGQ